MGLVLYGNDGSRRLTVGLDATGPAIHLSQDGNVRCTIAVVDADPGEGLVIVAVRDRRGREVASLVTANGPTDGPVRARSGTSGGAMSRQRGERLGPAPLPAREEVIARA